MFWTFLVVFYLNGTAVGTSWAVFNTSDECIAARTALMHTYQFASDAGMIAAVTDCYAGMRL